VKKTLIGVALVASGAFAGTGISFWVSYWAACRHRIHATAVPQPVHDVGWLASELGLSDQQKQRLRLLHRRWRAEMESFCATHCAARFALGEELARPEPDVEVARAQVERMNAVQAEAERATLAHILQVRALLNEQQGQRYAAMIHKQVCTVCPLGLHQPD
jgi:hypothetical protein